MWRPFLQETIQDLESAFHFNVAVPFELVRLAIPHLLARPGASIVNVVLGAITCKAWAPLVRHLQRRVVLKRRDRWPRSGPRIRVNGIMPGIVETEAMKAVVAGRQRVLDELVGRTRMRRLGTPADIGLAAVFLASPAASWITGVLLDVDGEPWVR